MRCIDVMIVPPGASRADVRRAARHNRRNAARRAQEARDARDARRRRQWWRAATDAARRLAYYRCMRMDYGMPAAEALAATRRFGAEFAGFDLIGSMRAALCPDAE